jgi:hypothetical protein
MKHEPHDAAHLLSDPAAFKIAMAKHFLGKIPKRVPESNTGRLTLEANIDSFLFFASSAIDVIKREINNEFELFDKENVFYIHGLRKKLADSGRQKKVKKIIGDYFTTPSRIQSAKSGLNTKRSSLWRLQVLRNKVTHGHILKSKNGNSIKITYVIRQQMTRDGLSLHFEENVKNPQKYFGAIFEDLNCFVKKTRSLILAKTRHNANL